MGERRPPRESGLAALVGAGRSRVGVAGAMRARDVSRPRPEDLAEAEATTVLRTRPAGSSPPRQGVPADAQAPVAGTDASGTDVAGTDAARTDAARTDAAGTDVGVATTSGHPAVQPPRPGPPPGDVAPVPGPPKRRAQAPAPPLAGAQHPGAAPAGAAPAGAAPAGAAPAGAAPAGAATAPASGQAGEAGGSGGS